MRSAIARVWQQEQINFLLTNRIPRNLATRFMGWFSQIEQPVVRKLSLSAWSYLADLDLEDARERQFKSLHDCFIRELRPGARPIDADPRVLVSPCDAIVGACGNVQGVRVFQAKGFPYALRDLFLDEHMAEFYRDGCYATLRITATMYHRFHAPYDAHVRQVIYISGDTFNVNPIALKRVERLFCRNERALIDLRVGPANHRITLVPVAAVLVASIRLHFADVLLNLKRRGPNVIDCDARVRKGEEMGWFQHGSTIIVFAPKGYKLCERVRPGERLRVGQPLMRLPS
jgi:phosphatidylserine decarboxylase